MKNTQENRYYWIIFPACGNIQAACTLVVFIRTCRILKTSNFRYSLLATDREKLDLIQHFIQQLHPAPTRRRMASDELFKEVSDCSD